MNSLKSPYTKESYDLNIKLYLKFCNLTKLSEPLTIPEPQKQIIKYITSLRERRLATGSINTMKCAIYHFNEMNDIPLNKKKKSGIQKQHDRLLKQFDSEKDPDIKRELRKGNNVTIIDNSMDLSN